MAIINDNQVVTVQWLSDEGYTIEAAYTANTTYCPTYEELNGGLVSLDISVETTCYSTGVAYTNPQNVVQHDIYQACSETSLTLSDDSLEWNYTEVTATTAKVVTATTENCITAVTVTPVDDSLCTASYNGSTGEITITPKGDAVGVTDITVLYEWNGDSASKSISCTFNDDTDCGEISADTTYIVWGYEAVTAQTVSSSTLTFPTCITDNSPTVTVGDSTLCTAAYDSTDKKINITPAGTGHYGETSVKVKFKYGISLETTLEVFCEFKECSACEIYLAGEVINADKTVSLTASCIDNTKKFTVTYIDGTVEEVAYDSRAEISRVDMRNLSQDEDNIKEVIIYPTVKKITKALQSINLTAVTIPNSVKYFDDNAFAYSKELTSVTIPNDTKTLNGFGGNKKLKRLNSDTNGVFNIPKTVTGTVNFWECYQLKSVVIPSGITYLDNFNSNLDGSFKNCSGLTSVTFDDNSQCTTIGGFEGCSALTGITIPNSVTTIGNNAFKRCDSLTSITIPNNVTTIGGGAFYTCESLASVTIGTGVRTIGKNAFFDDKQLSSINIPDNVERIEDYAFYYAGMSITSVIVGTGVTYIGFAALDTWDAEAPITIKAATPPTIERHAFGNPSSRIIYVPSGSVNAYKTAGGYWDDYADYIQAIP